MDKNDLQLELERLFNKNQTHKRIRSEFENPDKCGGFDFAAYMAQAGINVDFGFDLLTQMVLYKRTNLPTLVGLLRRHFLPDSRASQLAADHLLLAAEKDLVNYNAALGVFIIQFDISQDIRDDLDRFQYPLPMVVEPRKLEHNKSTAHLSKEVKDGSVILRNNHHDEDVCLDHLNRMNRIKFALNNDVATMIKNSWRNLDKPKDGETKKDFEKRVRAFDKYDRTAKDVMALVTQCGNEFYLTHKYDKRGRIYAQGYHISYQGAPWNKAVIELADRELVE